MENKIEIFNSKDNSIELLVALDIDPTIEEKGANLLYYISKNHSFVDGNKPPYSKNLQFPNSSTQLYVYES